MTTDTQINTDYTDAPTFSPPCEGGDGEGVENEIMRHEMPEEYRRFYSDDPYEVLGLAHNASREEIEKAKKKLQRKFHPDFNKDPMAIEISQNINIAYDTLVKLHKAGVGAQARTYEQARPRQREARRETAEELEAKLFSALQRGPKEFGEYVVSAKAKGIKPEHIKELIKTEQAQKILKEGFTFKVKVYGAVKAEECIKYMSEWKKAGIDVSPFTKSPEVRKIVQGYALLKITIWGDENPNEFLEFVQSWKKAGIDLSRTIELPEARNYLETRTVEIMIKIWGKENPKKFLSFVQEWKRAGVELAGLVNSKTAQDYLEQRAKLILRVYVKEKFKPFVQSWMQAGWQPSAEILGLLGKK